MVDDFFGGPPSLSGGGADSMGVGKRAKRVPGSTTSLCTK